MTKDGMIHIYMGAHQFDQLHSSKKTLPANVTDGMFHFWMFLHGIFALLAKQGDKPFTNVANAAEGHQKPVEVFIANHPSVSKIRCDDASLEDNKAVYMNLVAPADSVGKTILSTPIPSHERSLIFINVSIPMRLQVSCRYRSRSY